MPLCGALSFWKNILPIAQNSCILCHVALHPSNTKVNLMAIIYSVIMRLNPSQTELFSVPGILKEDFNFPNNSY